MQHVPLDVGIYFLLEVVGIQNEHLGLPVAVLLVQVFLVQVPEPAIELHLVVLVIFGSIRSVVNVI